MCLFLPIFFFWFFLLLLYIWLLSYGAGLHRQLTDPHFKYEYVHKCDHKHLHTNKCSCSISHICFGPHRSPTHPRCRCYKGYRLKGHSLQVLHTIILGLKSLAPRLSPFCRNQKKKNIIVIEKFHFFLQSTLCLFTSVFLKEIWRKSEETQKRFRKNPIFPSSCQRRSNSTDLKTSQMRRLNVLHMFGFTHFNFLVLKTLKQCVNGRAPLSCASLFCLTGASSVVAASSDAAVSSSVYTYGRYTPEYTYIVICFHVIHMFIECSCNILTATMILKHYLVQSTEVNFYRK